MNSDSRSGAGRSGRKPLWAGLALIAMALAGVLVVVWIIGIPKRPADAESLYQSALTALAADDPATARRCIFQLRFLPDQEGRVDLLQGMLDLKRGLLNDAVRELSAAAAVDDLRLPALALLGEALYRQGSHRQAQQVLREVLSQKSDHAVARRWLAASYYDIGAMQLAMGELAVLAQQVPEDGRALRLRALIQKDFELYQDAIEDYVESLRRDPSPLDRDEVLLELAACHLRLHQYQEAVDVLSQAEKSAAVLTMQAECERALDRPQDAVRRVQSALSMDPNHVPALLLHAKFLDDAEDLSTASAVLHRAVELDPFDYDIRFQLTNILRRLGHDQDAAEQAEEALKLQQLREEFSQLHEQAFLDTDDAHLRVRLAELAGQLGREELARTWYQAALSLDPDHPGAQAALRPSTQNPHDTLAP